MFLWLWLYFCCCKISWIKTKGRTYFNKPFILNKSCDLHMVLTPLCVKFKSIALLRNYSTWAFISVICVFNLKINMMLMKGWCGCGVFCSVVEIGRPRWRLDYLKCENIYSFSICLIVLHEDRRVHARASASVYTQSFLSKTVHKMHLIALCANVQSPSFSRKMVIKFENYSSQFLHSNMSTAFMIQVWAKRFIMLSWRWRKDAKYFEEYSFVDICLSAICAYVFVSVAITQMLCKMNEWNWL